MAQPGKVLASEPDNLSFIPKIPRMEGEKLLSKNCPLIFLHMLWHM